MDENLIQIVWEKGIIDHTVDEALFRKDACGAWIKRDMYGSDNNFGWVIDHIYPQNKGGNDNILNLRPMHKKNNESKSDDYPTYIASVTSIGFKNVDCSQKFTINNELQLKLKKLYHAN